MSAPRTGSAPWRGTFTVLVTPFTPDGGAVDVPALQRLVDWQIEQGIHGLIPLGSTGEFLSMTMAEQEQVIEVCVKQAAGRVPVLIGTGAEWTDDAVSKARLAERLGADGVMVIPPFYSTPTADELFEHYRRIGEAVSFPIMVYNNPATANVDLTPDLVARLSRIDNVRYIKESTLEVTRVRDILEACGDRMTVFAGILGYEERPLVSADYARDTRSSIVDAPSTMVTDGTLLKVYAWYDNEMGYACRMVDLACQMRALGV